MNILSRMQLFHITSMHCTVMYTNN
jgi:hypothetical protein